VDLIEMGNEMRKRGKEGLVDLLHKEMSKVIK